MAAEEVVTGRKTEAAAASCSSGEKAADAALVGVVAEEDKPAAGPAGDDEEIFVMSQDEVDYILSWDLKEDKFNRFDDDTDDMNKAYAFFRRSQLDRMKYQEKVREEYETYGYVRVEYDEEKEKRMSEAHEAAWLKAFGPDFRLNDSDSEDKAPDVIVQGV